LNEIVATFFEVVSQVRRNFWQRLQPWQYKLDN